MIIDPSHPRAKSLEIREKLVKGASLGITSLAGLLAHGRGEAFDYLVGEKTNDFAKESISAAAAHLLLAKKPILSTNGNSAAISAKEFVNLAKLLNCKIEVNLFHYSKKRVLLIESFFKKISNNVILEHDSGPKITIATIASPRKRVLRNGIFGSDLILVPLEDGDRTEKLISLGKKVVTIDLNPLSRTAQSATVTIVDNIVRAMPLLVSEVIKMKKRGENELKKILISYNNKKNLKRALIHITSSFLDKSGDVLI